MRKLSHPRLVALIWTVLADIAGAVIPQNIPLQIKQGGWCLDHQWDSDPDQLILYDCQHSTNQEFTWRQEPGWDFFHLISNQADKCVGFDSDLEHAAGAPKDDAPIVFKDCFKRDSLIQWTYLYGTRQLRLAKFPEKCLDFSLKRSVLVAFSCKKNLGYNELENQQFVFKQKDWKPFKQGMPVEIVQRTTSMLPSLSRYCMDQSLDSGTARDLILYECKGSANQQFYWTAGSEEAKRETVLFLDRLVSSKDNLCVAAGAGGRTGGKPAIGDALVLKECLDLDDTIRWRYAHGLEQLKLLTWPDLCMGLIGKDKRQMGVVQCHVNSLGWADDDQHFKVVDMGISPIPEHSPLTIQQNQWCLDQKFSASPDELILYNCVGSSNQEWIWRGSPFTGYHYLVSNLDDRCLGVDDDGVDNSTGVPIAGSKIMFKACNSSDDLIKWDYVYSSQQFRLKKWNLCMEFSEQHRVFVIGACKFEEYVPFLHIGDTTYLQRFRVSQASAKKLPVRLPVRIQVAVDPIIPHCLDRPPHSNYLTTWNCKLNSGDGFSINQEFLWRGNKSWDFSQLVSNVDLLCLAATGALPGAAVYFKECSLEPLQQWTHSFGKGFVKLNGHPKLCMGHNEHTGKVSLQKCQFDLFGMAASYQMISVVDLGFHEIKEDRPHIVKQNGWCLDRPWGTQTALNLYSCNHGGNQHFVWYNTFTWRYHYFISSVDNLCMGIAGNSRPAEGSPAIFTTCSDKQLNIRWVYAYGLSQLKMFHWPELCLDFDDHEKFFVVKNCTFLDGSSGSLWPAHNQIISFHGVHPRNDDLDDVDDDKHDDTDDDDDDDDRLRLYTNDGLQESPNTKHKWVTPAAMLGAGSAGTICFVLCAILFRKVWHSRHTSLETQAGEEHVGLI